MRVFMSLSIAVATLAASTTAQSCNTQGVHIIVARGTDEPQGEGQQAIIIDQVVTDIPGSDAYSIVYPANWSIPYSPNTGITNMQAVITQYAQACPNSKMVLMGYSQGAQVCASAVSGGGVETLGDYGPLEDAPALSSSIMDKVTAIVVFGDVNFIAGQSYDLDGCTNSVSIARSGTQASIWNSYASRLQSWCAAGDEVCCGTGTDPSAHTSYFNSQIAGSVGSFVQSRFSASSGNVETVSTAQSSNAATSNTASSSTIASSNVAQTSTTTTPSSTTAPPASTTTTSAVASSTTTTNAASSTVVSSSTILGVLPTSSTSTSTSTTTMTLLSSSTFVATSSMSSNQPTITSSSILSSTTQPTSNSPPPVTTVEVTSTVSSDTASLASQQSGQTSSVTQSLRNEAAAPTSCLALKVYGIAFVGIAGAAVF